MDEIVRCDLHAAAPAMLDVLRTALNEIRAQRGHAFAGSRIPYERDPRWLRSKAVEAQIVTALAAAEGKGGTVA